MWVRGWVGEVGEWVGECACQEAVLDPLLPQACKGVGGRALFTYHVGVLEYATTPTPPFPPQIII